MEYDEVAVTRARIEELQRLLSATNPASQSRTPAQQKGLEDELWTLQVDLQKVLKERKRRR